MGLIPGWGTKIQQASEPKKKKKKKRERKKEREARGQVAEQSE